MSAATIHAPLPLGPRAALGNRLAKAAMSERLAGRDGAPPEALVALYRRWAAGGAGLLITGNVMVDRRALGESGNVFIEDDRHLDAFRRWASAGRANGTRLWMQINHPGRQSPRFLSREPVAPSAVPMQGTAGTFARPRALLEREVEEIIDRFARAADVARQAGFDGVQIHGAHGYLVNQFLSPLTNLRDDRWGGDAGRRRRFLLEVIRAVRRAAPRLALSVKLNSADFQRGGFTEEESLDVVAALADEGVDLLEISGGTYEAAAMFEEPARRKSTREREAFFLDYAEKARGRTRLPLMVTGGFRTAAGMNEALARGALDVIGMARPLALEPDLPGRLLSGAADRARPVSLGTGIRRLDALIQAAWYYTQIQRLAQGEEADPRLGRATATVRYLRGPGARRRQEAPPTAAAA